jgi:hypothetical protein
MKTLSMAMAAALAFSAASALAADPNAASGALRDTQAKAPVQLSDSEMDKIVAGSTSKIKTFEYRLANGTLVCRFSATGPGTLISSGTAC